MAIMNDLPRGGRPPALALINGAGLAVGLHDANTSCAPLLLVLRYFLCSLRSIFPSK
jgi:hypothetical protein